MNDLRDPIRPGQLRRLSDEEIELWIEVARSVTRRKGGVLPRPSRARPAPAASATADLAPGAAPLREKPNNRLTPMAPLEPRLKRQLSRGRATVDGAIDLHGLTQASAHQALRGFLMQSQAQGHRLVLVVTGKGESTRADFGGWDDGPGVLRRLAPHWLRAPDLRSIVLGFEEAGRAHGGGGAMYVRLRRAR
jgi:DNA-nicking Smr family endonuclease